MKSSEASSGAPGDERTPDKTIGQVKYADGRRRKAAWLCRSTEAALPTRSGKRC